MKQYYIFSALKVVPLMLLCMLTPASVIGQDEKAAEETEEAVEGMRPARPAFESAWLMDNQTATVPQKKTLEFMIQHRFGSLGNGLTDLYGIFAPTNIRLGFSYTLFDRFGSFKGPLSIGFGTTKNNRIQDLNLKYAFLQQTRSGNIPVSLTYYGNMAVEAQLPKESLPNKHNSDRLSYFHQLMVAKRFSAKLSLQVSASLSHYNVTESYMKNDHIAFGVLGRFKISPQTSLIASVDQPVTVHTSGNPFPGIGAGIEVSTSSHAFQVFVSNYNAIVPQHNNVFNQNDPWDKGLAIGFNITRLWGF